MKKIFIAAVVLIWSVTVCVAQEAATSTAPPPKKTVVETAKESKAKRKKSTTRVITNKDVKKSKGKLIVISTPDGKKTDPSAKTETAKAIPVDQDARYRSRTETKGLVTAAEKKVGDLERAVGDLEQQYYSTNDPTYRDQVIQKRFTQSKRQLDEARQKLADLRDLMQKLDQPNKP